MLFNMLPFVSRERLMATSKLRQTKVPEEVIRKLKANAALDGRAMSEVFEEAVVDFFEQREEHLEEGGTALDLYNAAPKNSKVLNVELKPSVDKKIETIAEQDQSSGSRVLYTSLIQYARKKKLL
jgi:predicted transcriptional regulator